MIHTASFLDRLHQTLLSAFSRDDLRQLAAVCLDADFDDIVAEKGFDAQVFEFVQWAKRRDRIEELVGCAQEARPRNEELTALRQELAAPDKIGGAEPPLRQWVLVAGTGGLSDFMPALAELCTYLGERLAAERFRLVTGGWPGVDETVARAFAAALDAQGLALEDRLIQVLADDAPAFPGGRLVFAEAGEDYRKLVELADFVLLLGGLGGTLKTGELALRKRKPVLPLADTGGDAKKLYLHMLRSWDGWRWMGVTDAEFQRLARPHRGGVSAAVALMLEMAQRRTRSD